MELIDLLIDLSHITGTLSDPHKHVPHKYVNVKPEQYKYIALDDYTETHSKNTKSYYITTPSRRNSKFKVVYGELTFNDYLGFTWLSGDFVDRKGKKIKRRFSCGTWDGYVPNNYSQKVRDLFCTESRHSVARFDTLEEAYEWCDRLNKECL